MADGNLPKGWGKQQNIIPKAWDRTPDKPSEQQAPPVGAQETSTENTAASSTSLSAETSKGFDAEQNIDISETTINCGPTAKNEINGKSERKDAYENKAEVTPAKEKKTKAFKASAVVLVIALIAATSALIVFIVLYFSGKSRDNEEKVSTTSIAETSVAETVEATEKPTEVAVTEATTTTPPTTVPPTTAPIPTTESTTLPKSTEKPTTPTSFEEYTIWLEKYTIIYEKPYPRSGMTGQIEISTLYTIVDEEEDVFGNLWGKLKSGKGWVNLSGTYYEGEVSTDTVSVEINADHDSANDDKVSDNIGVYITETQDVPDFDGSGYGHRIII